MEKTDISDCKAVDYEQFLSLFNEIVALEKKNDNNLQPVIGGRKAVALDYIDKAIDGGEIDLYPAKAILESASSWTYGEIENISLFQSILKQGIDKGCLSPDNDRAWHWLDLAAYNNAPTNFVVNIDEYYDILFSAMCGGNVVARQIMDSIWEPEDVIDED